VSESGYGPGSTEVGAVQPQPRPDARSRAVDVVRLAVARVLEVEQSRVTASTRLTPEAGVDSLAYVEIVELSEQHAAELAGHPVGVDDEALEALCSVGDLAGHLAHRWEGGAR